MMQRAPVLLSIRRQLVCIFPQDQAISCCRSESGDPIFVFSSLIARGFTLYGRETSATTCDPSLIEYVRFVSLPCVSCGGQSGGNL